MSADDKGTAARDTAGNADQLLDVISDVERQLLLIKKLKEEREQTTQQLQAQKAELDHREAALAARQRELEQQRSSVETAAAKVREDAESVREQRTRLERDASERQRALDDRARAQEAEASSRAAELSAQEQRLLDQATTLRQQQESLQQARATLQGEQAQLARDRASLDETEADLIRREKTLADAQGELAAMRQRVEALTAEQAESRQKLERAAQALSHLQEEVEALSAERTRLEGELAQHERTHDELKLAIEQAKAEAGHVSSQFMSAENAQSELRRQIVERDARIQFLSQRITQVQQERDQQLGALKKAASASSAAPAAASGAAPAAGPSAAEVQAQLAERDRRIEELQSAMATRDRRIDDLAGALRAASEEQARTEALRHRVRELQEALRQRDLELEEARAEASRAAHEHAHDGGASDEDDAHAATFAEDHLDGVDHGAEHAEHDELREALEARTRELDDAHQALNRARAEIAAMRRAPAGGVPEHVGSAIAQRWSRLRTMKRILAERSLKVNKASEALRQRFEQCEQIIAQRDALAQARAAMAEGKRKLERMTASAAKVKVAAGLFYALGVLAGLGGVSWAVSGVVADETYLARAQVAAQTQEDTTPAQQEEWLAYVQQLLIEPAFLQQAAERMQRSGLASFSSPAALGTLVRTELRAESTAPGTLTFELKGQGADRTERVLRQLTGAVLSQANATVDRRADGLSTYESQPPAADKEPLDATRRPMYAAGMFLLSAGLVSLIAVVFWRRLASSKAKFEEEAQVDAVLDASAWRVHHAAKHPPESAAA